MNIIKLKDLIEIYGIYCPNKGQVSFEEFASEFMKINPNYVLVI